MNSKNKTGLVKIFAKEFISLPVHWFYFLPTFADKILPTFADKMGETTTEENVFDYLST